MLIKVNGLGLKKKYLHMQQLQGRNAPQHLIPLGDALWPEEIKAEIARLFAGIGVEDPLRQKLVEPYCRAFGGQNNDGAYDLEYVNWEMLVDYFKWEASAWVAAGEDRKLKAHYRLSDEMDKKWGGRFNHYAVYQSGRGY